MKAIDISSNNHGGQPLNFYAAKQDGYEACYIKIGEGVGSPIYINPYWHSDWEAAKAAGMKVGGYWFYNSQYSVPIQANVFNSQLVGMASDLIPMFDYEEGNPIRSVRDQFLSLVPNCGQYMDRYFYGILGHTRGSWLAWPGYSGQPTDADMIQFAQLGVPGMPNGLTDVNIILNDSIFGGTPMPVIGSADYLDAPLTGADGKPLNGPVVAAHMTSTGDGYWLFFSDGGVFTFGDAGYFGSAGDIKLNRPICAAMVHDDHGYALVAEDGGVFTYGDAKYEGGA